MRKPRAFLLLLLVCAATTYAAGDIWRHADPGHRWTWPRDHYAHRDYRTEWWYFTGHLQPATGDTTANLGFQLTFFRLGMIPPRTPMPRAELAAHGGVMAHAALTDPAAGRHVFSEVLWRETPLLGGFGEAGDSLIAWCRAPAGTDGRWRLGLQGQTFLLHAVDKTRDLAYDLTCRPVKPVVLHGDNGFSAKNAAGSTGSLYASCTRMSVTGSVTRDGRRIPVAGWCWMDHEIFSDTLAPDLKGWDWVSLQLDDGRDLMLYRLFHPDGSTAHASGTLVDSRGRATPLERWSLVPQKTWTSPATGAPYPVRWRLDVPAADLEVELKATMDDQENRSLKSGIHYWEGAVTATDHTGRRVGRGFVEMTGYGPGNRPPM